MTPPAPLRTLNARADWLTLAWQARPCDRALNDLRRRAADAAQPRCAVAYSAPNGWTAALAPSRRAGWYRLERVDCVVVVDVEAPGGWAIVVEQSGEHCAHVDAHGALRVALAAASALLDAPATLDDARLRRLDVCADIAGFDLQDIAANCWLTRRRARVGQFAIGSEEPAATRRYTQGAHVTGWTVAAGNPLSARIYDKRAQLVALGDDDRADVERDTWLAHGWTDDAEVTRVEFQLRGEVLAELGDPCLRDLPAKMPEQLDRLWSYLSTCWLQLIDPDSASRRSRCEIDPRWKHVQGVTFSDRAHDPIARRRRAGRAACTQAVGCAFSAQATAPQLRAAPTPHELRAGSEPGAALWTHATVHGAMKQTAEDYLATLLQRHAGDAREAAAWLAEKLAGIRARQQ